jgi:hypothetical protein
MLLADEHVELAAEFEIGGARFCAIAAGRAPWVWAAKTEKSLVRATPRSWL